MATRTPTKDELKGIWLLESVHTPRTDGGVDQPFGSHPDGTIIYLAGGTMAVHIRGSESAASKLRAYAGQWRLADECVVHEVQESVEPELRGVRLERRAEYDPATGILIYTTREAQGPGHPVVRWRKTK